MIITGGGMKKAVSLLVVFLFTAVIYAQNFSWDIMFLKGKPGETVPVNRIIRMETGEEFLISITTASDCYCYIVCYDTMKEISVLYDNPIKSGNEIFIGPYEVDNPPGTENFYVIMSLERLTNLENLIRAFNDNPNSQQHSNNLYREVVSLQNKAQTLGEPPSVFIPGGGTSRGGTGEYITRFTDKNFYVRTITIRH
jgi:hypothetical protein